MFRRTHLVISICAITLPIGLFGYQIHNLILPTLNQLNHTLQTVGASCAAIANDNSTLNKEVALSLLSTYRHDLESSRDVTQALLNQSIMRLDKPPRLRYLFVSYGAIPVAVDLAPGKFTGTPSAQERSALAVLSACEARLLACQEKAARLRAVTERIGRIYALPKKSEPGSSGPKISAQIPTSEAAFESFDRDAELQSTIESCLSIIEGAAEVTRQLKFIWELKANNGHPLPP